MARLKAQKESRLKILDPAVQNLGNRGLLATQHSFKARSLDVDQFGRTVAIYDHYWRGIRVSGANTIGILDQNGNVETVRYSFKDLLEAPAEVCTPKISLKDSGKIAVAALGDLGAAAKPGWQELVLEPQIERVAIPWPSLWAPATGAGDPTRTVRAFKGWKLVYQIHHAVKGGREARLTRVDALTGQVLSSAPTASCAPTTLTANSQYYRNGGSQQVPFTGDVNSNTYALRRGNLFGVHEGDVLNPVYTSSSPTYGDGSEYNWGSPLASANGQTQAADIMIGLNKAYNFYQAVYGRNHIDGSDGYYVATAAHQENLGDPSKAWWFRTWLGQESYWIDFRSRLVLGSTGGPTELSVTAHEWTHLVNYRSARVGKDDSDSFGAHAVNEAMSTIMSTACRLWDATGGGGGIGYIDPLRWKYDWSYEPQVYGSQPGTSDDSEINAVEFLFRPSRFPRWEPSWWNYGNYGVNGDFHRAGAPLHRAFYFLANGARPISNQYDETDGARGRTTPFMPWGFDGIGANYAALVFYQALTQTMHQSTDLPQSALDLISAGNMLFGAGSPSAMAVRKALAAVNLITPATYELPWGSSSTTIPPAPIIPNGETFFYVSGYSFAGNHDYYTTIFLPPYSTILFSLTTGVDSISQAQEGLWIEIRSEDGQSLLASGSPSMSPPPPPPIETPTVDPTPLPDPQPTGSITTNAQARYKNPYNYTIQVLIKFKSSQIRTLDSTYLGNGIVQLREPIEQADGAAGW